MLALIICTTSVLSGKRRSSACNQCEYWRFGNNRYILCPLLEVVLTMCKYLVSPSHAHTCSITILLLLLTGAIFSYFCMSSIT